MLDNQNHYEVLGLGRDAGEEQIRTAYDRVRKLYLGGSMAVFAVISPNEQKEITRKIDEAYRTLIDHEARREYDAGLNGKSTAAAPPSARPPPPPLEIRPERQLILPMNLGPNSFLQTAPRLSKPEAKRGAKAQREAAPPPEPEKAPAAAPPEPAPVAAPPPAAPEPQPAAKEPAVKAAAELPRIPEPAPVTIFTGPALRGIRESKGLTMQALLEKTKISRRWLENIEHDRFSDLPAPAYVRGYLRVMARVLGLPADQVVQTYMAHWQSRQRSD